jgi:vacuolar protein sorting-associated protein 1
MSLVNDKMTANKPPADAKGKLAAGQVNNNKDLDVEIKKEEPGFFGSFWKPATGTQKKKPGTSTMEAVSYCRVTTQVEIQLKLRWY